MLLRMTALILQIAQSGREATDAEIEQVRADVAAAGFDPAASMRAGLALDGLRWSGRLIRSNDWIGNDVRHYLRHVVAQREWPPTTTFRQYIDSLRATVSDGTGGIYLSRVAGTWSVAFLAQSASWRGMRGGEWILVEYRPSYGFWVTGFQPRDGLAHVTGSPNRTDGRWLREPS